MVEIDGKLASLLPGVRDLLQVYKELDIHIENFWKEARIKCFRACGKCCEVSSQAIEASIFEMIPLAIHLWKRGKTNDVLEKINLTPENHRCVLYDASDLSNRPGCCEAYPFRPLMCRLFGFSAVENKYGNPVVALCSAIKQNRPELAKEVQRRIDQGLVPPIYQNYASRVLLIDPMYGLPLYPINKAIRMALERIGYGEEGLGPRRCLKGEISISEEINREALMASQKVHLRRCALPLPR